MSKSGVAFTYDPFGRRIEKATSSTTSIYAYDDDGNLIEETNSSGAVVARYSQGLSIDEPLAMLRSAASSFYQADGLGSVTSLSNGAGSIANTYTYDSFGKLTNSTGSLVNPFQYTARESDTETGLYYYRARYYDPNVGRFLSEDQIDQGMLGEWPNLYVYVKNAPINTVTSRWRTVIAASGEPFGEPHMTRLRCALGFMFLFVAPVVNGQTGSSVTAPPRAIEKPTYCKSASLPSDIQNRLKAEFGSWKIQEPADLSKYAQKTWSSAKLRGCPGIAVGQFEGVRTPSYAVLLVPTEHPDAAYRFLVFSRKGGRPDHNMTVVEKSDDNGASNFFIRKILINRYFTEDSKKKFQVQASEGILMVDSAEQEYEADVYFWSGRSYQHQPVDY